MALRTLAPSFFVLAMMLSRVAGAQPPPDAGGSRPKPVAEPADDVARARDLFNEGASRAEAGDWEGARDRFERSLKLKRAPLTLYNLGIAQQETGHLVDAVASFRAFLAAPVEPATQRYVDAVKAVVAKLEARLARIEIDVRPVGLANVAITIDGHDVPPTGPYVVDPGAHEVAVTVPGFGEARQKTSLADGARASIVLDLTPRVEPTAPPAVLPVVLTAGGVAVLSGGAVVLGIGARQGLSGHGDAGASKTMLAGAGISGVGALALGAGVTLLVVRSPRRLQKAAVQPWIAGSLAGVRGSF